MTAALSVMAAVLALTVFLALRSRRGKEMNLEQWTVGGRSLGSFFVFLLLAGEIYTTTTFLGISGFVYSNGGAALYILSYVALAYVTSYWLLPAIWRYAKQHRLITQPDFFAAKYQSSFLGGVVALVGVIAMVPFLVLQLKGLGIIASEASYGALSPTAAICIGVVVLAGYVTVSGLLAAAWTAVVKDILIVVVVGLLGIYLPVHYFGGLGGLFDAVQASKPNFAVLHTDALGTPWFISTVLLTALGFYMWPHMFAATLSARDDRTFRKNAVIFPLYQLFLLFVFFIGFVAVLEVPGLNKSTADLSLLRITKEAMGAPLVGLVGGVGMLAALVPGAMLLNASATLLAHNVYRPLRPAAHDKDIHRLVRILVPCVAAVALFLALKDGAAIVNLLLLAYSFVTQLAPALLFSLLKRNPVNSWGAAAGMVAGTVSIAYLTIEKKQVTDVLQFLPGAVDRINSGVAALFVNLVVLWAVSALTTRRAARLPSAATAPAGD
jgi:solute:Na+ symporter, SSS family